jgi:hypothetical protein
MEIKKKRLILGLRSGRKKLNEPVNPLPKTTTHFA